MKVTFPKNIKKWILAGMMLNMWPISISIIQLFLLAVGVGISLAVFNSVAKSSSTAAWVVFAVPIMIIFIVITFFKVSEMWLLEYIAKLFRNYFFDTNRKFQSNFQKTNNTEVLIKESKLDEKVRKLEPKSNILEDGLLEKIEKGWLV